MKKLTTNIKVTLFMLALCLPQLAGAQETPKLKFGGFVRFNTYYDHYDNATKKQHGAMAYDVFTLQGHGSWKNLFMDADYRLYAKGSGGGMLYRGLVGYKFNDQHQLQLGLTDVPFGIMSSTANSYYLNLNYYIGLSVDHDMGLKYSMRKSGWEFDAAFFKNSDLKSSPGAEEDMSRYSFDVGGRNKEVNQANIRLAYNTNGELRQQFGLSAELGGLYNLDTEKTGHHHAYAFHYVADYRGWNLKAQFTDYKLAPRNAGGESRNIVKMVAYGGGYSVASRGRTYNASLAYTWKAGTGVLSQIKFYNDFSYLDKADSEFHNSWSNILGMEITAGPVIIYADYVTSRNHAFIGNDYADAFAVGKINETARKFNLSVGYYF